MTRRLVIAVAASACAVLLAGCGDDGPTAEPSDEIFGDPLTGVPPEEAAAEPPAGVVQVLSVDNRFQEEEINVSPGTEVRWVNAGQTDHDVVAVDPSASFGVPEGGFEPGVEYSFVFDEPGEYRYYCSLHGTPDIGMIGTVIVEARP